MILCRFLLQFHLLPPPPPPPPPVPPGYGLEGGGGQSPECRRPDSLLAGPHSAPGVAGSPRLRQGGG